MYSIFIWIIIIHAMNYGDQRQKHKVCKKKVET
jgi:hypothetical protein